MTVAAMARGIKAVILDGSARDIDAIRAHGFPVFGRGTAIRGTLKQARGAVGVPIMCGGQLVWPGDVIVADVSGVVAIRAANAAAVAEKAAARRLKEAEIMAGLRQGRTTIELLGLDAGEQD
jgi:4-hydroxy-4-methyl-2-oxoglutarate aldolase